MSAAHRPGWLSGLYAAFAPLIVLAEIALALTYERLLLELVLEPELGTWAAGGAAAAVLVLFAGGVAVLVRQLGRPRRSPGRLRLLCAAIGGLLNALGGSGILFVAAQPETMRNVDAGLGLTVPDRLLVVLIPAGLLAALGALTVLVASLSSWSLIPSAPRKRLWIAVDVLLSAAFAWAVATLPVQPPSATPDALELPLLRHVITTLFALRLLIRLMPPLLSGIEATGFEALVAARHLRSKKSGFLTAISLLSVFAVTLSCVALTVTLSVMGGFRNDLKRKILGNNPHIVIDREQGHIEGWSALLDTVERVPGVSGASAYASGEVMMSSASNLATAVLRGIDPSRIGKVNDLPHNLTSGKLEYLSQPERLLHLPEERLRDRPLLLGPGKLDVLDARPEDAGAPDETPAPVAGTGSAGAPSGSDSGPKRELDRKLAALEAFLRDAGQPKAAETEEQDREVLPGIVIGQELARSLRLYVGDEVNVVAPLGALGPSGPMPKARPFRVAGIFYSGMYEYDMKFTYVALEAAQKFLNLGDAVNGIEVRVADVERAPVTTAAIRRAVRSHDLRVRDWQELNSRLFGALALEKLAMFVALGIAILVASFCIAGTLTLMVQEKGREVAILKAMGTSDRAVVGVFVIEGGLIGLLGAALGLFLGYMACFAAEHFGIRMNPEVYYIDRLPVHVDPAEFVLTGVAAVLVCLAITVYPALLASRLRPIDALRYE